ncbi:hypothetical protein [Virgibacillus salexigens]|uniref:hypothetical protein n=1 Tax=Virgibacillus salexigens TaxID=61016 RepID=UPI001909F5E9|nr:hypothetical protein [Virgibacillus salexigens]
MMKDKESTVITDIQKLIDKAEMVKKRFADSLEKAKKEVDSLIKEIEVLDAEKHEMYKGYVLGDFDISVYQEAKSIVEGKQELLQVAEAKVNDISSLEQEELATIYQKYEEMQQQFQLEKQKSQAKTYKKLMEAKHDFLQQVADISKEEFRMYMLERKIGDVEVDAGLKNYNYIDYYSPYFKWFAMEEGSDINIGNIELHEVYRNRKISPSFMAEYNKQKIIQK